MKSKLKFILPILGLLAISCASDKAQDSALLTALVGTPDDGNKSIVVVEVAGNFTDYTGTCYDTFTVFGTSNTPISPTNYYLYVMFGHSLDTELRKSALSKSTCSALGFLGSGIPTNATPVNFKSYTCDPNLGQASGDCGNKIRTAVGFPAH
ncbi:hypothetical protein EHQ61_01085 [Leptospira wolffii]|uniref:LA_3150 family lipoprotein n=1 Tax=Leptospira wolffii TaxID=409998 RepID=UPI0002E7601C|nr:hypothetical protein [Leptospira wolffii]EPG67368.1 putative lipoprotein [Leptospira wolffii serovar Khorat str. Khorat-H2]TGL54607.1 hypothetical protein EHQ61_01085 [Leptospira wolffii]